MAKKNVKKSNNGSSALAKRVSVLEQKQKADDKATEQKVQYYYTPQTISNVYGGYSNFILRTQQGVEAEGNTTPGDTRIGNQVLLRSAVCRFYLQLAKNSDGVVLEPNTGTICRIIMADNLTDNTQLGAADILQNTSYPMTSTYKNAISGGKRYRILMDKKITITGDKPDKSWSFKLPLPKTGRVVRYNGNLSTNPSDFNITLMYVCDSISPVSPNKPLLNMFVKSRFEDA